ncbi:hypothetical protein [Arenibacter amylolyticus]|uniref:hypothetical protein n=1 Tax=Arenibacter amylolyticus TaxID=1406873 RepID=UPI000A3D1E9F|nr:hypothetical protein [Arenibacter amylolyticus]
MSRYYKNAENKRLLDIKTNKEVWQKLQKLGINNYDELYNLCLFSSIVYNDISILYDNYVTSKSETQKNLFGRLLCLTIIEFLDDISPMIGKNLRNELISNEMSEFVTDLKDVGKEFSRIKNKNNSVLRKIRNESAAHKTKQSQDLIIYSTELPFENLDELNIQISTNLNKLRTITTKIIKQITEQLTLKFKRENGDI